MTISHYALKKRAKHLRGQIADFGFETEDDLTKRFENYCRNHPREVPRDRIGRRGHEVLWLEKILRNCRNSDASSKMRRAQWDRAGA